MKDKVTSELEEQDYLDKEYINRIKLGDNEALNFVMEKYKNFVFSRAKPFFIIGGEKEDIIQEGMIGLFKAIKGYDETKEVTFRVFADICIRRQIMTAIKSATRQKHIPLNSYLSLNKAAFDEESDRTLIDVIEIDTIPDPLETITSKEYYKKLETDVNGLLSDFEQRVLVEYLNGCSYVEIAKRLNSHTKAIDNAVQRIKKKVGKHMANEENLK